ncbi:TIGR02391 family protein [Candidatus Poriferisodalis sp.]|uniref:TIGR02391 family protein n=1 Tax=Candidatus Poriferisodalis sp. TaxID=3101277 RepID=UPI003B01FB37
MLDLDPLTIEELPVDELGLRILDDLEGEWNTYNYFLGCSRDQRYQHGEALRAIQEAIAWLSYRGLIAPALSESSGRGFFITRAGHEALVKGLAHVRSLHQVAEGLHPEIESRARRQFLLGEYEQAVFVSMKAIEVRVRALSGLGDDLVGVDLMNRAFGKDGSLADANAVSGEREGRRALFAGAYAVLRNPAGHRDVDYDDVAEAAEAVATASLLMRILDAIETGQES